MYCLGCLYLSLWPFVRAPLCPVPRECALVHVDSLLEGNIYTILTSSIMLLIAFSFAVAAIAALVLFPASFFLPGVLSSWYTGLTRRSQRYSSSHHSSLLTPLLPAKTRFQDNCRESRNLASGAVYVGTLSLGLLRYGVESNCTNQVHQPLQVLDCPFQ